MPNVIGAGAYVRDILKKIPQEILVISSQAENKRDDIAKLKWEDVTVGDGEAVSVEKGSALIRMD